MLYKDAAVNLGLIGAAALYALPGALLAGEYEVPRTPWGDADLQGTWPSTHVVAVPFERPPRFGTRLYLTDEEFEQRRRQAERQHDFDHAEFDLEFAENFPGGAVGGPLSPPPHWLERGEPSRQSSLIIEPTYGRLPPMTPAGEERQASLSNTYVRDTGFATFKELGPYDRCISRGVVASMMPVVYNNGNQIVQSPGYVVLRNEMMGEARIIPLDGRPHLSSEIRTWMGDSRGHWDGDTLIVRTRNLNGRTGAQGNGMALMLSAQVEIEERYTRTDEDTIHYRVTVNDPGTWTAPWTAAFDLRRDPDYTLFEYACHEGNYAMRHILSASRAHERTSR